MTIAPDVRLRQGDGGALDPLVGPQCSLAVQLRRASGAVIGRGAELEAISQELREASGRLAAVTLEGEPGIGKTRLLLAASELASANGFTCVAITADEQIRGPFLLARSLFASGAIREAGAGTPAEGALKRTVRADVEVLKVNLQSETWTAGEPVQLKIALDAGERKVSPQKPQLIRGAHRPTLSPSRKPAAGGGGPAAAARTA